MSNLLKNPNLQGFTLGRYFTEADGRVGAIENPLDWEFVAYPKHHEDPERIPQSLHRESGFEIAAVYRSWEAGYVQRNISVQPGRYLARAVFRPDIAFPDANVYLDAVTWRFVMESGGTRAEQDWQMTQKGEFKHQEELHFVFQVNAPLTLDYFFMARSVYAGNSCDLDIYELTLTPVAADYGGVNVPTLGTTAPVPSQPTGSMGGGGSMGGSGSMGGMGKLTPQSTALSGQSLEQVLTVEDIQVFVAGLRAMQQITNNSTVLTGMERLAQALEKLL
jgi:hypothetical protein